MKDVRTIVDGDVLTFAGLRDRGHPHARAHARAACCFRTDALLLSGDLVFAGAIGRCDFPNSSPADMESLRRFLELPDRAAVLPGPRPGPPSGANACRNPFLAGPAEWSSARREGPTTCCRRRPTRCSGCTRTPTGSARLYGLRYVETPTFEHTELFARTSGETSDVVTKEMYTFEDKGGRSLTLRPEQTAPRRPRVPRARPRPADAVQGVLRVAPVPARTAAGGTAPGVPAVRGRDDRGRRLPAPTSR